MFPSVLLSNPTTTSLSEEAAVFSSTRVQDFGSLNPMVSIATNHNSPHQQPQKLKKKRNLPGNPDADPNAEVIALSPKTLLATNRFVCEICLKGFQRDQNLQLHRRGHNLPWKLKQRNNKEIIRKRAYVCPEPTCVHHHPSRALGDLTGIKKHFCRKHGEKKWKCEKCSKIYAVQSDWKAHSKTCGTREYRCDCGTLFSRKDSFVTHRAFCDALAEESARVLHSSSANHLEILTTTQPLPPPPPQHPITTTHQLPPFHSHPQNPPPPPPHLFPLATQIHHTHFLNPWDPPQNPNPNPNNLHHQNPLHIKPESVHLPPPPPPISSSPFFQPPRTHNATSPHLSATALLQKAANIGAHPVGHVASTMMTRLDAFTGAGMSPEYPGYAAGNIATWKKSDRLTRDFLGLTRECGSGGGSDDATNMLSFTGGVEYQTTYERDQSMVKAQQGFGFAEPPPPSETWGKIVIQDSTI
ncbi:hypothetical protein RHMOL_Rhmol01G0359100 [Rhododendron molle]|uniref:Uncharacterized protein n=1 Tax=Rhododendron molle TaxID=49168 RepID=A0ACC0QC04_RHOML|nr:hypothetical protein RHMOL_Rhmol01G0359100 [Rhododendron molle]